MVIKVLKTMPKTAGAGSDRHKVRRLPRKELDCNLCLSVFDREAFLYNRKFLFLNSFRQKIYKEVKKWPRSN